MVCGADGGECGEVLRDVWLFLDDEMDPERRRLVQQHLDDCSPCLNEAGLDAKLKSLLHSKCGGDKAPDELRAKLIAQLTSRRVSGPGFVLQTTELTVTERTEQ